MKKHQTDVILTYLFGRKCEKCPTGRMKHHKDAIVGLLNKRFYKCNKCKRITSNKLEL